MVPRAVLAAALISLTTADVTSLMQTRLNAKSFSAAATTEQTRDVCECLNWKSTYESKKTRCGVANELFMLMSKIDPKYYAPVKKSNLGTEFCTHFYETIDDNVCTNIDMSGAENEWYSGQWCYVSSECTDLNGGKIVKKGKKSGEAMRGRYEGVPKNNITESTTGLSWKICKAGQDRTLRDMDVPALAEWSKQHHVDLGVSIHEAYFKKEDQKQHDPKILIANKDIQNSVNPLVFDIVPHKRWEVFWGGKSWVVHEDEHWDGKDLGDWKTFEEAGYGDGGFEFDEDGYGDEAGD